MTGLQLKKIRKNLLTEMELRDLLRQSNVEVAGASIDDSPQENTVIHDSDMNDVPKYKTCDLN